MGISEEEKDEGAERIFEDIMAEDFPNLMRSTNINTQEALRAQADMNPETHTAVRYR